MRLIGNMPSGSASASASPPSPRRRPEESRVASDLQKALKNSENRLLTGDKVFQKCRSDQLRSVDARFVSEIASGPGVTREFVKVAVHGLLSNEAGLFIRDDTSNMYWFNPACDSAHFDAFHAFGALISLALVNDFMIEDCFPMIFFKKLMCSFERMQTYTLDDLQELDPMLAKQFHDLLDAEAPESFGLDYVTPCGHPLVPGGEDIPITKSNRERYVKDLPAPQARDIRCAVLSTAAAPVRDPEGVLGSAARHRHPHRAPRRAGGDSKSRC